MIRLPESERKAIAQACRRHGVARMYVFGSALRDDFRPGDSDVDLLVEFCPMPPHQNVVVWGIADRDVPVLRRECAERLQTLT